MPLGTKSLYHAINANIHHIRHSFSEETGRCALLQLGDILQTLPEVYMLLIIHGGDDIRARMHALCKFFRTSAPPRSASQSYPNFLLQFHLLLTCHAAGSGIFFRYLHNAWHYNINAFISKTHPSYTDTDNLQDLLKNYMAFLM